MSAFDKKLTEKRLKEIDTKRQHRIACIQHFKCVCLEVLPVVFMLIIAILMPVCFGIYHDWKYKEMINTAIKYGTFGLIEFFAIKLYEKLTKTQNP